MGYFNKDNHKRLYLFPVFHYNRNNNKTKTSVLFFAYRRTKTADSTKTAIVWPICEYLKHGTTTSFRIAPILWYKKTDTSTMISVQPLHYSYKSATKHTVILAWFLYKHERITNISVSNSFLWKVLTKENYADGSFETRFLYLLYANIQKPDRREKSILPFYHNVEYANGDRTKSLFFGFYNYFKQRIAEIDESYEEDRIFWFIRLRSNYAKLKSEGKEKYLKRK
jgi:hypothetical protein